MDPSPDRRFANVQTPGAEFRRSGAAREDAHAFLDGGGQMGERIRELDWTATAMGSPAEWPAPLRTALRILLNTNHPVFLFWGPSLTCIYNDAYARSLGPERHPMILGMPGSIAWSEIWPVISPQIDFVMRGDGSTWHENQLVPMTRFGQVENVYWTYSYGPIHDEDAPSGVGGVLVLCTETTERVMAEERLRVDAERWRTLFDQSPGFICVLRGPQHRFEYVNAHYLELIGRESLPAGLPVCEVIPEVVGQGYLSLLDAVFRTGRSHAATGASITLAGVERFLDFVYQPIRSENGFVTGILVQGYDITERQLSQERLRESASRLQLATDAAELGIHEFNLVTGEMVWDERVRNFWGVPADATITFDGFMQGIIEEDRELTAAALERAQAPGGDGCYVTEFRVRDGEGSVRWLRATGHVTFDGGVPLRLIGAMQDISRQKSDEATLRETDRRKDIFLATLAHELRNPLAPIANAAQVLSMSNVGREQVTWAQKVITRQAEHMASLLNDLLDVARLAQGRLSLKRELMDIAAVLESALEAVQPQLQAKQHHLRMEIPHVMPPVLGDTVRLSQVFTNLLSNAIRYTEADGSIEVVVRLMDRAIEVTVHDTGVGMTSELLGDVFGMFRQSEHRLERAEGGLGIGLALARSIVELHGGSVSAASAGPGMGSSFTVSLPRPADSVTEKSPSETSLEIRPMREGKRVLIADDNRDAAESLAILLQMHGHDVQVAPDGVEAVRIAASFLPDVMLVDIGMPRMNGYEVVRVVRANRTEAQPRMIALTGWGMSSDRERALEAGFDAHLTKPPVIGTLLEELGR